MKAFRVSPYISIKQLADDRYILWNNYSPSILKLNGKAVTYLECVKSSVIEITDQNRSLVELLSKYRILYSGESDPSRQKFIDSVNRYLNVIKEKGESFLTNEEDYEKLKIVNDRCNLACSYCVNMYKHPVQRISISEKDKKRFIFICIDQFFQRKKKRNKKQIEIAFNGGEIFLEWELMKEIIEYISTSYSDMNIEYAINSNFTLMTPEIARFFSDKKLKMFISIDGYGDAHDWSRIYGNGKGSFKHVIRGLEIFRRYNPEIPITGFQGTIDSVDEFVPEAVYDMKEFGFSSARLAPNLLNITVDDAIKKAKLMGNFLELNDKRDFYVTETYFENMKKLINLDNYFFFFNCKGLSCYPKIEISINIDTLSLSQVCSFIQRGSVPFNKLNFDIYHPGLWEVSWRFIKERMAVLLEKCIDCELVAICRGGCIYSGLDKENQVNEAACIYQKELWKIYLSKLAKID